MRGFWTLDKVAILRRMWKDGIPLAEIADAVGAESAPIVGSKAHTMGLGPHPSASRRRELTRDMRGAMTSSAKAREENEERIVKMPRLRFLESKVGSDW